MIICPLPTHTKILNWAHIFPRGGDNRLTGTTLYKSCSGIPSFTNTIMPQISTWLIYPAKQKMRRPSKNTLMNNGMRCWTQHPPCLQILTLQMKTLHIFPVTVSVQRSQSLSLIPATCSSECWQSNRKNEPSFPTYSKINDLVQDPMRDPFKMATMPKKHRNITPLQRPDRFGDVVYCDIVYGSGTAIGGYRYTLWFVERRSKHIEQYPLKSLAYNELLKALRLSAGAWVAATQIKS